MDISIRYLEINYFITKPTFFIAQQKSETQYKFLMKNIMKCDICHTLHMTPATNKDKLLSIYFDITTQRRKGIQ